MKNAVFLILLSLIMSCSTYDIKVEVDDSFNIGKLKKTGVFLRIPDSSIIQESEYKKNLDFTIEGNKKINDMVVIKDIPDEIIHYNDETNRFLQLSEQKEFLKYKSIGIISLFARKNESQLKKIMSDNSLDSLLIYEIDGVFSHEMQFIDFNSMIIILDKSLNIAFMDYQSNMFDLNEYEKDLVKKHLVDRVSGRFLQTVYDLDFLTDK